MAGGAGGGSNSLSLCDLGEGGWGGRLGNCEEFDGVER